MRSIFDIDDDILACVDIETGEIIDEAKLEALQIERDAKIEGVAMWKKENDAQAAAIGEEIRKLQDRKRACENRSDSLKRYLANALNGQKFKSPRVSISYRSSDAVIVDDITQLSDEYLKHPEPEASKTAIKDALKAGKAVPGAHLETNVNLIVR